MAGMLIGPSGRTTGGISGSGGKNVAPIYKMQQGGYMGTAKIIQGPQKPKKKKPSLKDKIKKIYEKYEEDAGGSSYG